jgi:hypothetical protein
LELISKTNAPILSKAALVSNKKLIAAIRTIILSPPSGVALESETDMESNQ